MLLNTAQFAVLAAVLVLWIGLAIWATLRATRAEREANRHASENAKELALARLSPTGRLLIARTGQVSLDVSAMRLLNAQTQEAFDDRDRQTLIEAADEVRHRGQARSVHLATHYAGRRLQVELTPSPLADGEVLGWLDDRTERERHDTLLVSQARRAEEAFSTLAQLIEAAPIPMWHRDAQLRLSLVNRAYVDAVEAGDANEVIERELELVETREGQGPKRFAEEARQHGAIAMRTVAATIGGERRSIRVVDVPLGTAGVAGYAIDNHELDRATNAYRRFVETQRDTLDRLSAGVAQFGVDRSLTFSNRPFQQMFALRPEWLADRPEFDRVIERMREAGRVPEMRDFPAWKREKREWFHNAQGASEESWLLPGGAHLRVVAQPLPDGGLLVIFEDRTEQIQLASARDTLLRVREATLENLFEAIGVFAADGRLHLWNNRFRDVWGFDEGLLRQFPRVDILAEAAAAQLASPQRAALMRELVRGATVDRQSRTGRIALKDGRHFEFAGVPLPDGNALFAMLDITDSRRIERVLRDRAEALEASDRVKTAFVANMSYELRTPLTSIAGFAEMLAGGYAGELPETAALYVRSILDAVARLTGHVDDLLHVAQSEAGLPHEEREQAELSPLLHRIADEAQTLAGAKRVEFLREIHPDLGRTAIEPRRLQRALAGLLNAAVEAARDGGKVTLQGAGSEGRVRIAVRDQAGGWAAQSEAVREAREQLAPYDAMISVHRARQGGDVVTINAPR